MPKLPVASLLLTIALPLLADGGQAILPAGQAGSPVLQVGPSHPVTAPPLVPAIGTQSLPVIATAGSRSLIAWSDYTLGREGVWVALLDENGQPIIGSQHRLYAGGSPELSLVRVGLSYVLTWGDGGIHAAALDDDGNIITAPYVMLPAIAAYHTALASNGQHALFLYIDQDASPPNRGALLDDHAHIIKDGIKPLRSPSTDMVVGSDGDRFYIFTRDSRQTGDSFFVTRVSGDGDVADQVPTGVATMHQTGARFGVAFDGKQFALVAFEHLSGEKTNLVWRFLIDPGTLTSTSLPTITTNGPAGISVAWTGHDFVAYWLDYTPTDFALMTLRFGDAAPRIAAAGVNPSTDANGAWNGRKLLVAWTDRSQTHPGDGFGGDVYGVALDSAGAPGDEVAVPHALALSPQWQGQPAVASDGTHSLIVWGESVHDGSRARLFVARATNGIRNTTPLPLTTGLVEQSNSPAVIYTGPNYLVFWHEPLQNGGNQLFMRRVSAQGVPLGEEPTLIAEGYGPSAAFSSDTVLLTYTGTKQGMAQRLDANGNALDEPFALSPRGGFGTSVTTNGTDFFVAWMEGSDWWQFPSHNLINIFGARIDRAGHLLDPASIEIATGPGDDRFPRVASDGRDFLVVYTTTPGFSAPSLTIATKRVLREGQLADTTAVADGNILTTTSGYVPPAVVGSGDGYLAAWNDSALRLGHLDGAGKLLELAPLPPITGISFALAPADFLYAAAVEDSAYGLSQRVFLRHIGGSNGRGRGVGH